MDDTDIKFLHELASYFDSLRSEPARGLTTDAYVAARCRSIAKRLAAIRATPVSEREEG